MSRKKKNKSSSEKEPEKKSAAATGEPEAPEEVAVRPKRNRVGAGKKDRHSGEKDKHQLFLASAKGHISDLTCVAISPSGDAVITSSRDRAVRKFDIKQLMQKNHRHIRYNIDDDDIVRFDVDSDGARMVVGFENSAVLRIYALENQQKEHRLVCESKPIHHQQFVRVCFAGKKTVAAMTRKAELYFFDADSLALLKHIQTNQLMGSSLSASRGKDRTFVTLGGFTSDTKVFEVCHNKAEAYEDVKKVMELKGHKCSLVAVSFARDGALVATASKDGFVQPWDLDVRYADNEDPRKVKSFAYGSTLEGVELSPCGKYCVTYTENDLYVYGFEKEEGTAIAAAHKGPIACVAWAPNSKTFASCASNDKEAHLWRRP